MRCSKQGHRKVEFAWNEECPVCAGTVPPHEPREADGVSTAASETRVQQEAAQEPQDGFKGRPGSALASLIPDWATTDTSGCGCKSWIKKMDRGGVQWVVANRDAIVQHIVNQKKYLKAPLNLTPDAACRIGANKLLDKAMEMASPKPRT
jgi:hypothetical protein